MAQKLIIFNVSLIILGVASYFAINEYTEVSIKPWNGVLFLIVLLAYNGWHIKYLKDKE